jgi:hypothetical protein
MPGLDPGIHAVTLQQVERPVEWIAGSSPAMTNEESNWLPDDARAARKHPDIRSPHADVAPFASATLADPFVLARAAAIDRAAAGTPGDPLAILPDPHGCKERLVLEGASDRAKRPCPHLACRQGCEETSQGQQKQCFAHVGPPSAVASRGLPPRQESAFCAKPDQAPDVDTLSLRERGFPPRSCATPDLIRGLAQVAWREG